MELDHRTMTPGTTRTTTESALGRTARWLRGAWEESARRNRVDVGAPHLPDGLAVRAGLLRKGERVGLASAEEEVWVVVRGHLELMTTHGDRTARTGDRRRRPENTPGHVATLEDTRFVSVAVLSR